LSQEIDITGIPVNVTMIFTTIRQNITNCCVVFGIWQHLYYQSFRRHYITDLSIDEISDEIGRREL
jgi:hypothetical protein